MKIETTLYVPHNFNSLPLDHFFVRFRDKCDVASRLDLDDICTDNEYATIRQASCCGRAQLQQEMMDEEEFGVTVTQEKAPWPSLSCLF